MAGKLVGSWIVRPVLSWMVMWPSVDGNVALSVGDINKNGLSVFLLSFRC